MHKSFAMLFCTDPVYKIYDTVWLRHYSRTSNLQLLMQSMHVSGQSAGAREEHNYCMPPACLLTA